MNKKKILVVGGTGFIGSNLINRLKSSHWNITSISTRIPTGKKKLKKVNYIKVDISKKKQLELKVKKKYDCIVNFGGYVDHSNKVKTYQSHFVGCKNLVNLFKKKFPKKFIQLGSSLEYGNIKSPLKESFSCKPNSIYGKSKLLATNYLVNSKVFNKSSIIILRLFQAYGPRQETNRLIPHVIDKCIQNKKFNCTSGTQRRDFIYIDDLIDLIILCLKNKNNTNGIFNVGSGKPKKIKYIINYIKNYLKKGKPQFGKIKMRKDESLELYPSIKEVTKIFKWKPKTELELGLNKTIKYFKKNEKK